MENKTLVIYYSFTGNSKRVAEYVKNKLNADILELEPAEPFSSDYDEVVQKYNSDMIIISPQLDDWGEESANDTIALVEYFSSQGVSDEHAGLGLFAYDENVMTWIFNKVK